LRAAFAWSRENADAETALRLVSSLQLFWIAAARFREGLAGFDTVMTYEPHVEVAPAVWVRAVADQAILAAFVAVPTSLERAQKALSVARQLDDPALLARMLNACGQLAWYDAQVAQPFFAEAISLIRAAGDRWKLCQILSYQAAAASFAGEPSASRAAAEEGLELAQALGDRLQSRACRVWLGIALWMQGNLADADAIQVLRVLVDEARAAQDLPMQTLGLVGLGEALAYQGQAAEAYAAAHSALAAAEAMGGFYGDAVYTVFANAALAAGDAAAAREACETAWRHTLPHREVFTRSFLPLTEAALACGDLVAARRWADDTVAVVPGWHRMVALTVRAFVAIAQDEPEQAERDAHNALEIAARTQGYLRVPDTLECLARLAADGSNDPYATRLLGAAGAIRLRTGEVRFPVHQAGYDATVATVRDALGHKNFDFAWTEGAALSTEEAIAYAQRGRGERKRPTEGWESLTPTERDVIRLVSEGLSNKDIAAR
jgi:ATP/maltotriose-dependent transcriptional regulator MalT